MNKNLLCAGLTLFGFCLSNHAVIGAPVEELLPISGSGLSANQNTIAIILNGSTSSITFLNTFRGPIQPQVLFVLDDIQYIQHVIALNPDAATRASELSQLSPQPLQVWRNIAFDNVGFMTTQLDNHLAGLRYGPVGFDTASLTVNDSSLSGPLAQIKGRLLAWNPDATSPGLVSDVTDPVLGGVTMTADPKTLAPVAAANPWSTFISGGVVLGDLGSDADVTHAQFTTGNMTAGADYRLCQNWTVGGLFGYGHTYAKIDNAGSNTTVDNYSPGIYAAYADRGWYANGVFSYDYNQYQETRNISFLNRTATGSPDGNQYNSSLDGGYEFHNGHLTCGPAAALQYVHLQVDGFTENNAGAANLAVNEQQVDSLRSRLGGAVRGTWQWYAGKVTATPHLSAFWQHEYLDNSNGITSQFAGQGLGSFTVSQSSVQRDSALIDTGLDVQWNQAFSTFIDYSAQAGQDNFFAQSIQAGVKVSF